MKSFDILITTYTATPPSLLTSITDFLDEQAYTYAINDTVESSTFWMWLPIITHREHIDKTEKQWNQLTDTAIIPIVTSRYDCPTFIHVECVLVLDETEDDSLTYLDDLHHQLKQSHRLSKKIKQLKEQIAQIQHLAPTPTRTTHLHDLQTILDYTRRFLTEHKKILDNNQTLLEDGIQALLNHTSQNQGTQATTIVGSPPQGASYTFKGREQEVTLISDYVLQNPDIHLISILGQGGVGKTALACYVLDTLANHDDIDIILYLSAENRNQQFSLERLFMMTGEAIDDEARGRLNRVWHNEKMMLDAQIDYLIDEFVDHRILILFDNLEDSLSDDGAWIDEGFNQLFNQFLERTHQATIILTSRIAVRIDDAFASITRIIPLDQGLSDKFAIELLYEHDTDDCIIYRDIHNDILKQITKKTKGYPRALEAVTGLLINDPTLTIDTLLEIDTTYVDVGLVSFWVDHAESKLDADQRMVMQALSIYARPVNETAIRFLLEPYIELTAIDITFTIDRLRRGRFITINQTTGDISMHPLDKAYNYDLIKTGEADIGRMSAGERFLLQMNILPPMTEAMDDTLFTRVTLEKRAGDFYAQLRGNPAEWQTIHDMQPYFLEYEHRLRALDYETSFTMLITIYNLLKLSGFSRKIVEMIRPLIDHLTDTYLMTCYNMLGMAYDDLGLYKHALNCHLKALPIARQEKNRPAEAAHLSGIGLQYSNLGQYDNALDNYEQALEISRETGKRKQERGILNNMAVVYNSIGRKLEGLHYYEESLEIAREIDDKQGIAVTLANIGDSYGALGKVEKTIECYQESIEIYTEIGDKLGRGVTIGKMGNAAIMLGSYEDALKLLQVAVNIAQAVGNQMWTVIHQADVAAVHAHLGDLQKGLDLLEMIIPQAKSVGSPILINYTHSLLAGILLYDEQLERARTASEIAIKYVNPANRHYEYALYGLILTRLEQMDEAQDAFNSTLDHAAELLDNTPDLYSPKYSRGLALMGLALVTDDMSYAEDAKTAYIEARQNCDAKGIITREMRKLKLLTGTVDDDDDPPLLSPPNEI